MSATSDAQGLFTVRALKTGDYTITVKYAGFDSLTQTLRLAANQSAHLDLRMKVASTSQDIEVYAGREGGEIEAINRTLTADNILNVLPADVITSLPNANVADAIGRLPSVTLERDEGEGKYVKVRGTEPRLTHTTLDGVTIASPETVRQIKLDIIPADLVESVQISKTLQADMDGDGIGGSVDLRTKSAQDRPTVYLEGTGDHTNIIGGRPAYQFDGTLGKRFLLGRAAQADIAQYLPLLVRDSMAPALKELVLMSMEDIGHFKPMSVHAVLFPPCAVRDIWMGRSSSGLAVACRRASETWRYRELVFRSR